MPGSRGARSHSKLPHRRTALSHWLLGLPCQRVYSDNSLRRALSVDHCSRRGKDCQAGSLRSAQVWRREGCSHGTGLRRRGTKRRRHVEEHHLPVIGRRQAVIGRRQDVLTGLMRRRRLGLGQRAHWHKDPGPRRRPATEHFWRMARKSVSRPCCGRSGPDRRATSERPCRRAWRRPRGPERQGRPGTRWRHNGRRSLGPARLPCPKFVGHSLALSPRPRAQHRLLELRPRRRGRGPPRHRRHRRPERLRLLQHFRPWLHLASPPTCAAPFPGRRRSTRRTSRRCPTASTAPPGPSASSRGATDPRRRARAGAARRRSGPQAAELWRASRLKSSQHISCPSPTTCRRRPQLFKHRALQASRGTGAWRRMKRSGALPKRTLHSELPSRTQTPGLCTSKRRSAASRRRHWCRTSSPDSGSSVRALTQPCCSPKSCACSRRACDPQRNGRRSS